MQDRPLRLPFKRAAGNKPSVATSMVIIIGRSRSTAPRPSAPIRRTANAAA